MADKISMQLAEKMIRLEQSGAASLNNKNITYSQTEFFRAMPKEDKKKFESYLRSKKRLPALFGIAITLPMICYTLTKISFTGNVIMENVRNPALKILGRYFFAIFLGALALFIYYKISNRNFDSSFSRDSRIVDDFITDKPTIRHY